MADNPRRRVMITGIASSLARRLARALEADDRVESIVGVDDVEPPEQLGRTQFVRADVRNPLVAKVVESAGIDTLVHLGTMTMPGDAGGRARMKELNVIGSMQLLGAAQKAPSLRKVVVRSTTAVYGSHHTDPSLIGEERPLDAQGAYGYTKDVIEVERYARDLARRRDDVAVTLLRFANFIGPTADSPLTRYLSLPIVPTMLGYDPRVQLCHEEDAVGVLHRSLDRDHPGTYNVAGPGVMYLSQALRLAGRPTAPVPSVLASSLGGLIRRAGQVDFAADQLRFLRFGRVADITRLRQQMGYEPAYSTREAFEDFLATGRIRPVVERDTLARLERGLSELVLASAASGGYSPLGGTDE